MFVYDFQLRVRYSDTDRMGYVYYGNYPFYYEQARAEAIRSLGFTYKQIEDEGTIMPITRMSIKYAKPAFYDELLTIRTLVPHMPRRIIVFQYQVFNQNNELINEGDTHLTFIDILSKKIKSAPSILTDSLKPFFKSLA
jgi:acyl-CoA thioester hydrolase